MNGATNLSIGAQTPAMKEEPGSWGKEDLLSLLDRIKSLLPEDDCMKFKTTESHFDWEKVRFGSYTGDMCKQKWLKLSMEVRKFRTMSELIADAFEVVRNPYKGKKLKTHPDFPKKPLTPYFRFFMEKRAKYAKLHPEMSNLDLTKILSRKYKELPEKKKMKYIEEFQREKESFEGSMARFKDEHPELLAEPKKSDVPEKPKTPQQLWYNHEKKGFLKLHPDVNMKAYLEAHPHSTREELVKSVLTKAEQQLKDKFDGRPTKPPPNGYSLYCGELMANMKEVPSTERMVLCSRRWKMMSQKEKDMYQKLCEQKKKQYELDMQRFLVSLPEEERERVMMEEKMGSTWSPSQGQGSSPPLAKALTSKEKPRDAESVSVAEKPVPEKRSHKKKEKLPETPKTAEEMWQRSVTGDYLVRFRNDRRKAQAAMEATWKGMEKQEKIPWIKKAAEDQKRYERELAELRTSASSASQKKLKFNGEPKKPPMSGYQMFSQELLTNGELNHFCLKERMVEIGKRWQRLSQPLKDGYKKMVEEQQIEYKAELDSWIQSLSASERVAYKEYSNSKRRVSAKPGATAATVPTKKRKETSDEDDDDDQSDSDSGDEEDSSASSDSDDDDDDDENDAEEQSDGSSSSSSSSSSSQASSDSDSE